MKIIRDHVVTIELGVIETFKRRHPEDDKVIIVDRVVAFARDTGLIENIQLSGHWMTLDGFLSQNRKRWTMNTTASLPDAVRVELEGHFAWLGVTP